MKGLDTVMSVRKVKTTTTIFKDSVLDRISTQSSDEKT